MHESQRRWRRGEDEDDAVEKKEFCFSVFLQSAKNDRSYEKTSGSSEQQGGHDVLSKHKSSRVVRD